MGFYVVVLWRKCNVKGDLHEMTARSATRTIPSKIPSPTCKIFQTQTLCFNCLQNLAEFSLFLKQLCRSLSKTLIVLPGVGYSFPFLPHMWRQLSEVFTLVDYPANQQSFLQQLRGWERLLDLLQGPLMPLRLLPFQSSSGLGPRSPRFIVLSVCHRSARATPQQRLARAAFWRRLRAEGRQLQAQMVFLYNCRVCLSAGSCFPASVLHSER